MLPHPLLNYFTAKQEKKKEKVKKHKQPRMSPSHAPREVHREPKGVYNLGNSHHLSVILQAIAHNPHMTDYLLRNEDIPKHCTSEGCVACTFTESLKQLLSTADKAGLLPVTLLQASWTYDSVR